MYARWADPEIARQVFENAITAAAASFLALAALVAILAGIFILRECLSLLGEPGRTRRGSGRAPADGLQIVYRSRPIAVGAVNDKIHA